LGWHRQVLLEWVERLDLRRVVLVTHGGGGLLGLTLPPAAPRRYVGLLAINTALASPQEPPAGCAAYRAPFPDAGHRAATRAFPFLTPERAEDDAASDAVRQFWREQWQGRSLLVGGAQDPALQALHDGIRGCPEPWVLPRAGHFAPESHGREIAERALTHFG